MGPLGIDAALARISEIRSMVGMNAPRRVVGPPAGGAFADVLAAQFYPVPGAGAAGDVSGYGNGRIPAAALAPIAGGEVLLAPRAAATFEAMSSEARRAGVTLSVNDGYRSLDRQRHMADELGLYREGGSAAVPGTSTHGLGVSVDIETGGGALGWLRQNAARFGFVEDVAGEPWHWTYRPASTF